MVVPIYCTIYNIIKFMGNQNIIYCQSAYPLSVNIDALQSQISNISSVKIILSTQRHQNRNENVNILDAVLLLLLLWSQYIVEYVLLYNINRKVKYYLVYLLL